jgi:hypothetical protein
MHASPSDIFDSYLLLLSLEAEDSLEDFEPDDDDFELDADVP